MLFSEFYTSYFTHSRFRLQIVMMHSTATGGSFWNSMMFELKISGHNLETNRYILAKSEIEGKYH